MVLRSSKGPKVLAMSEAEERKLYHDKMMWTLNSLLPLRCEIIFHKGVFETLTIDILNTSCAIGLEGVPCNAIDNKSALVQVMACCLTASSHYLSQYWSWSLVLKGPIENKPVLVQIVAWCWTGTKPLTEPMMTNISDSIVSLGHNELNFIPFRETTQLRTSVLLLVWLICFCFSTACFVLSWHLQSLNHGSIFLIFRLQYWLEEFNQIGGLPILPCVHGSVWLLHQCVPRHRECTLYNLRGQSWKGRGMPSEEDYLRVSSCHIEAETKWTPFRTQHFQRHFLEWKYLNSIWNFIEICSIWSN